MRNKRIIKITHVAGVPQLKGDDHLTSDRINESIRFTMLRREPVVKEKSSEPVRK